MASLTRGVSRWGGGKLMSTSRRRAAARRAARAVRAASVLALVLAVALWPVHTASAIRLKQTHAKPGFDVVVLSTYPRSGTSWLRELVRGATGVVAGASSRTVEAHAREIIRLRTAPPEDRADVVDALAKKKMLRQFRFRTNPKLAPQRARRGVADAGAKHAAEAAAAMQAGKLQGIKDSVLEDVPDDVLAACNALPDVNFERALPPFLIKSHFPAIKRRGPGVDLVTTMSDRRIHLVRNPFDTIVSGFHGSNIAARKLHKERWEELVSAAAKNETTEAFTEHLSEELRSWVHFQEWWLQFESGNKTNALYVHYEDLCVDHASLLPAVVEFSGIKAPDAHAEARLRCTVSLLPCTAPSERRGYPEHLDLLTEDQIDVMREASEHVMRALGYRITGRGKSTTVSVDPSALDAEGLLHARRIAVDLVD